MNYLLFLAIVLGVASFSTGVAQTPDTTATTSARGTGSITGTVLDGETGQPVVGSSVRVVDTRLGGVAGSAGSFTVARVPAGVYRLTCTSVGFHQQTLTDIVVKPGRTTAVEFSLSRSVSVGKITVRADLFPTAQAHQTSVTQFSSEEIRRSPGSGGDISRIVMGLPSIAKTNDSRNSLLVRGGNPTENTFYINTIEIGNINHFPTQGSSGGPIGILNVDFIRNVQFYAGGFPSRFGDKLSSVMDISFRDGARDRFAAQLDLNFAGYGATLEGPFALPNSSWLVSARRSYLDLLVKAVDAGTTVAPRYNDYQGILSWDIDNSNRLELLAVVADDHASSDNEIARENEFLYYGDQDIYQYTVGAHWRNLWGSGVGYSNTSLSYSGTDVAEKFFEPATQLPIVDHTTTEGTLALRNVNNAQVLPELGVEFGLDAKLLRGDYSARYGSFTEPNGNVVPARTNQAEVTLGRGGAFASILYRPVEPLSISAGVRADANSFGAFALSPRLSLGYLLGESTTLSAAAGIFRQNLPLNMLAQNSSYGALPMTEALHLTLGVQQLLTESLRFGAEAYLKRYSRFPQDSTQPNVFLLDELFYSNDILRTDRPLRADGRALSYGLELTLQKKFTGDFYGLCALSISKTLYTTMAGAEKERTFDNRYTFSIEGGYKLSETWEASARWIYAGGAPYTPFDIPASTAANRGVPDGGRVNAARYPAYHSLNVRVDKRFLFESSSIVVYVSVWNVYNRQNVASYYWNAYRNEQGTQKQFGLLPVFGVEWEL